MNMKQDVTAIAELFAEAHPCAKNIKYREWLLVALVWASEVSLVDADYARLLLTVLVELYIYDQWDVSAYKNWCYRMKQEGHWQ